jgi:protoporphyrinogen/coproporphyrinogen III oxidase
MDTTRADRRGVAVIGAGISGLSTALALTEVGQAGVAVYDGAPRVGGRIDAGTFAGVPDVDAGADAFLARVPDAVDLARRVGLADDLVSPEPVGAAVWLDGLHEIPDGLLLGVPGRLRPLATTRLLSRRGKMRAALEPLLPRTSIEQDSIGAFIRSRFGNEVHERLVDALVGSIYATDTDHFSLAEVPQLHALATQHRSLLLAARDRSVPGTGTAASGPVFAAPRGGMSALTAAVADAVTAAGGIIHTSKRIERIERGHDGWLVHSSDGTTDHDAVICALPPAATASIVRDAAPEAAALLTEAEAADVIMVTLHVGTDQWPDRLHGLSGYLVPKPVQRWVTAASFGSQKWAHWRPPSGGQILRVSLGRDGRPVLHLSDREVVDIVLGDLERHLGVAFAPLEVRITRWPGAFAQYRPHHARWVTAVEAALPAGVFVTGAGFRGIGIPACVRDGELVATRADSHVRGLAESGV